MLTVAVLVSSLNCMWSLDVMLTLWHCRGLGLWLCSSIFPLAATTVLTLITAPHDDTDGNWHQWRRQLRLFIISTTACPQEVAFVIFSRMRKSQQTSKQTFRCCWRWMMMWSVHCTLTSVHWMWWFFWDEEICLEIKTFLNVNMDVVFSSWATDHSNFSRNLVLCLSIFPNSATSMAFSSAKQITSVQSKYERGRLLICPTHQWASSLAAGSV